MKKLILLVLCGLAFGQTNIMRMLSGVNAQTGTSYTLTAQDSTRIVTFNNASLVTVTLPSGSNANFGQGTVFAIKNLGVGTVTIQCSGCTIDGSSSISLSTGQSAELYGGVLNYTVLTGGTGGLGSFNPADGLLVGTNAKSGQQALSLTPDVNGVCGYYGGQDHVLDQLSDVNGVLYWNPLGPGAPCQQVLTALPRPVSLAPQDGQVYAWSTTLGGMWLGAAASFPVGITVTGGCTGCAIGSGTSTSNGTIINAGTSQAQPAITITGATTSDVATCSLNASPVATWQTGIQLLPAVVTANTVTPWLSNPTAGNITPAAMVIRCAVVR